MLARITLIRNAITYLTLLKDVVRTENGISLTDESTVCEDFFKDLLNLMLDYKLVSLNLENTTYPGADLGDYGARLCIQVTADNSREKIQDCINKFHRHKLGKKFDSLVVLLIGTKKKYNPFETGNLTFDERKDIWDIKDLAKRIRTLETKKLLALKEFFETELEGKFAITSSPVQLTEEDIRAVINLICEYVVVGLTTDTPNTGKYRIGKRAADFIDAKNKLNSVGSEFFDSEIRHSLTYQSTLDVFLKDPINLDVQSKYFEAVEGIQKMRSEHPDKFSSIEDVFEEVFRGVVIDYENRDLEKRKVLIVLHNMYFNCDIGENPRH